MVVRGYRKQQGTCSLRSQGRSPVSATHAHVLDTHPVSPSHKDNHALSVSQRHPPDTEERAALSRTAPSHLPGPYTRRSSAAAVSTASWAGRPALRSRGLRALSASRHPGLAAHAGPGAAASAVFFCSHPLRLISQVEPSHAQRARKGITNRARGHSYLRSSWEMSSTLDYSDLQPPVGNGVHGSREMPRTAHPAHRRVPEPSGSGLQHLECARADARVLEALN